MSYQTSLPFYFCSVKFHYVKETHDVSRVLVLVKIAVASQHKRQRNKSLLTNEKTDSDLKGETLHYANELLVSVRLAFQELLWTRQTSRNNDVAAISFFSLCHFLFRMLMYFATFHMLFFTRFLFAFRTVYICYPFMFI